MQIAFMYILLPANQAEKVLENWNNDNTSGVALREDSCPWDAQRGRLFHLQFPTANNQRSTGAESHVYVRQIVGNCAREIAYDAITLDTIERR